MISGIKVGPFRSVVRRRSVRGPCYGNGLIRSRTVERTYEILECGHEVPMRSDRLERTRIRCRRCVGMKR